LFIGCFSNADDEGRLKGDPAYLKAIIFPGDTFTDDEVLAYRNEVAAQGLIHIYRNGNSPEEYIALPTFPKYQTINKRYPSKLPPPPTSPLPHQDRSTTSPLPHQDRSTTSPLPGKSGVGLGSVSDLKSRSDSDMGSESESGIERPRVIHNIVDNSPQPTDPTEPQATLDNGKDEDDLEPIEDFIKRLHTEFFGELEPTPKTIPKINAAISLISQFPDDEIVRAFEKARKQHPPPKYPLGYVARMLKESRRSR